MELPRKELNFVACPSYHGATLLALLLNNHSQLVSLGDSIPPALDDNPCGCGKPLRDCAFWLKMAEALDVEPDTRRFIPSLPVISRKHRKNMLLNAAFGRIAESVGTGAWRPVRRQCEAFLQAYQTLIETTCELSQRPTFIDGSKNPVKIYALENMLRQRPVIRVLHLTRDPRAFMHSCHKYNDFPIKLNARFWRRYHRFTYQHFANKPHIDYLRLRLEDLCKEPDVQLAKVQRFFGVEPEKLTTPNRYESNCHLVGNGDTIRRFDGQLRLDTSYREAFSPDQQAEILGLTNPLAEKFSYT